MGDSGGSTTLALIDDRGGWGREQSAVSRGPELGQLKELALP